MNSTLKRIIQKVCFGNSITRKRVTFGKGSYIREHAKISGGQYIQLGSNTRIYPYCRIECFDYISGKKLSPRLKIGDNVLIGRNDTILCANSIEIGNDCMLAANIFISDENHGTDLSSGKRYECNSIVTERVCIGKNCWIGEKAIILPGVTIGDNAIIGAGSVVTKNIPANVVAVGNPARVIKKYNFNLNCWERIEK